VSDVTPTRSAAIALAEERRAMREGHAFLDEKCLLLAAAMLRELQRFDAALRALQALQADAATALASALERHGLQGLQCYPAGDPLAVRVGARTRSLLGVALQDARLQHLADRIPAPLAPSPEAEHCRDVHAALASQAVAMAAMSGNLERLYREYRRSVRRTRALQDVLLPELDRTIGDIETRLEELEQDEALWIRQRRPFSGQ
jgi:V/A-type H+-transporting ATPase subunit D